MGASFVSIWQDLFRTPSTVTLIHSVKIASVRSYLLSYPLPEPLHLFYYGGERTIVKRDAMLIRVETSDGLVGYGPGEGSEKTRDGIESGIAPFLEGRVLADPDALRIQFIEGPGKDLAQSGSSLLHGGGGALRPAR